MNISQQRRKNLEWSGRLIHWSLVTTPSDQQDLTYINSFVADEDGGEQQTNEPVRHLQTFGFRSRPPVNSEIVSVSVAGSGSQKVAIASDNMGLGPSDLKEGESVVYSQSGSTVLLDKDGNVTIIPKSGAKVRLGSGTPAELDAVALYTQLQSDFDAFVAKYNGHVHVVTGTANLMTGAVAGTAAAPVAANQAAPLSTSVASSNVQAKK